MKKKERKRFFGALECTILTGASIHLVILAYKSFMENNLDFLNMFSVLEVDYLFPAIGTGLGSFILSFFAIGAVFAFFYSKKYEI